MKLLHQQKDLVTSLERDIYRVNALSARYRGEGEGQASVDIMAEMVKDRDDVCLAVASPVELTSAAESLLPIISSQRERFRQQVFHLEAQNLQQQHQLHLMECETSKLRSDNIKLYEKIKFLESYCGQHVTEHSDTERRYSSQYEERLDPFSSFSRQEQQRRYVSLSPFEKIIFGFGRFILSNKTARTITFIYMLLLHILVFLVLYRLAYTESWTREISSTCAERFAEHMQQVHGEVVRHERFKHE